MFIREVELFQQIPSHIIDEIAQFATEESYSVEQVLFREGDFADYLYILEDGQIAVTLPGKETITFPVDDTGSVFGWSALVEPRRYTATAECTMESKVIKIDGERLLRLFERHPNEGLMIMRRLAGVIGTRLVQSYRRMGIHRP
jgi:CRP-like cAMP-binding protein